MSMSLCSPYVLSTSPESGSELSDRHAQEWLDSGVDPLITAANVKSLSGNAVYDYLFYSDRLPRTNTGRLSSFYLKEYADLEEGGWWCSGLDPLNGWAQMLWGQFKADHPRRCVEFEPGDRQPKIRLVKYDPPPKVPTRAYFLAVPDAIAQRIYRNAGVTPNPEHIKQGFWHCVWVYNLPVVITEGAKKAGALLTAGYAAIALPGISSGYRSPKDSLGQRQGERYLIPELAYFATPDRRIYLCFDHDSKASTRAAVQTNLVITGHLLSEAGCQVQVITLPGPEKGVDDFLVQRSPVAFAELYQAALPLKVWRSQCLWQLSAPGQQIIHQRFLDLELPQQGLVCLKSPKGTGKTALLEPLIRTASQAGRRTLVISHRIQLGRAICARLGLDYITELSGSETLGLLGYGLCIDSLHAHSQARFNVEHWRGAIVILDECEQVLWHVLNSSTCQQERVAILDTLRALLQVVLSTGGLVIAQDADLSDFSIELLKNYGSLSSVKNPEPFQEDKRDRFNKNSVETDFNIDFNLIVNTWKPNQGWDVFYYKTPDPAALWISLEQAIAKHPVFICMDSQKPSSKWGTINVEARLQQQFPEKRILRIDSHTVADPTHPAYGCIEHLNEILPEYDIVIASPSVGTGVSIDIVDHFGAVFGIFQGAIPDNEVRQAIARVRQPVPRHVWVRPFGVGKIANGASDYRAVAACQTRTQQLNLRLLRDVDFDLDGAYDPITFRTWAKFAARVNASLVQFREGLEAALIQEGHHILPITPDSQDTTQLQAINEQQSLIRDRNCLAEAEAIANAPDISEEEYQSLKDQRRKTPDQRRQEEKYRLHARYGVNITPDLYLRHQDGWYSKLRLQYYLTQPANYVHTRDRKHWKEHLTTGGGQICPQDVNTYSERIETLRWLRLPELLQEDIDFHASHPLVMDIVARSLQYKADIKTLLHLTLLDTMSPMQIIQSLLGVIGLKLERDRRARLSDNSRCWMYRYCPPTDGRDRIFQAWQQRDCLEGHPPDSNDQYIKLIPSIHASQLEQIDSCSEFSIDSKPETKIIPAEIPFPSIKPSQSPSQNSP